MVQITVLVSKLKDCIQGTPAVTKSKTLNDDLAAVSNTCEERMIAKQEILLNSMYSQPQLPLIEEKPEEIALPDEMVALQSRLLDLEQQLHKRTEVVLLSHPLVSEFYH